MHEETHPERIFTKEEMDDMWLRMLHAHTLGDHVEYVYNEWAVPLGKIYKESYGHGIGDQFGDELVRKCQAAYFAGWNGDLARVDNFVGGHELSREEPMPIRVEKLEASMKTLKVRWSPVRP